MYKRTRMKVSDLFTSSELNIGERQIRTRELMTSFGKHRQYYVTVIVTQQDL